MILAGKIMHNEIKILDLEKHATTFRVVFEVPGKYYNQDYPERIRHTFPLDSKWFQDVKEDGHELKRFEEYLIDNYIEDQEKKKKKQDALNKIEDVRNSVKNKKLDKSDKQ